MKYFSPGLLDGSVTTAKLAADAVTTDKLAAGAVTTLKLADDSVSTPKIVNIAVTSQKLTNNSITTAKLTDNVIRPAKIRTNVASLAGTVGGDGTVDIVLESFCFFPMIHVTDQITIHMSGHIVDGADPDAPRFGLENNSGVSETFDVDYRNVES